MLGFGIPALVRRMLRGVRGRGRNAAAFATWGGAPFASLWQARGLLRRKGFRVGAAAGVSYPFNWTQVVPSPSADLALSMTREGDAEAARFAATLADGAGASVPGRARIGTLMAVLSWPVSMIYSLIGRYLLGALYAADARCNACGICARDCPASAIVLAGKGEARRPLWRVRCEGCNRCINLCPRESIQMSIPRTVVHLTVNVAIIVVSVIGLNRLSALVALPGYLSVPAWIALFLALAVYLSRLQAAVLEPLLFRLEGSRGVRKLLGRSWTVSFPRYKAEGFKPGR